MDALRITENLTREFLEGTLDLSERPNAPTSGWAALPEFTVVERIRAVGASDSEVRTFITVVAALDRARDAERLWNAAAGLFEKARWAFAPQHAAERSLRELQDALAEANVSQRHGPDTVAWRLILDALADERSPATVRRAVFEGSGDAAELRRDVIAQTGSKMPWFPFLQGPKVSVMWVRMLAAPGRARITNLAVLPVAVDVQVRKVSEYLGVADTAGLDIEAARGPIQAAWRSLARAALGPRALAGTAAALDPALWFYGRWGCSFCEDVGQRHPVGSACQACRFSGRG